MYKSTALLNGFEITEREPIDAALTALGVPVGELAMWSVRSEPNPPQNTYTYRDVVVSTRRVSKQMREAATSMDGKYNDFRYCEQFSNVASRAILKRIALHVTLQGRPLSRLMNEDGSARSWPLILPSGAASALAVVRKDPFVGLAVGLPLALTAMLQAEKHIGKPFEAANKLLSEASPREAILRHEIGKVLVPNYADAIDSVA